MPMRPSSELMASVMWVLMRSAMSMPVIRGISSTQGVILKVACNDERMSIERIVVFES